MGHNASHYFYVTPVNKPKWTNDIHQKNITDFFGFDPFENNGTLTKINDKTYKEHLEFPNASTLKLTTTYPGLLTGSGYSHYAISNDKDNSDFQLGFFFDHTIGVPIIPGSSVKGVIRNGIKSVLNSEEKFNYLNQIIDDNKKVEYLIKDSNWEKVLFGRNVFLHAFPIRRVYDDASITTFDKLKSEYGPKLTQLDNNIRKLRKIINRNENQKKLKQLEKEKKQWSDIKVEAEKVFRISKLIIVDDAITPHHPEQPNDIFKDPNPIKFIKVPAGIEFQFQFLINGNDTIEKDDVLKIFKEIIIDFGICAKRNVGYGHFEEL